MIENNTNLIEEKSANQLWRESGTTLPFKEWIEKEKNKDYFILNKKVEDTLSNLKDSLMSNFEKMKPESQEVQPNNNNGLVGLNKFAIGFSILIVAGALAYALYHKKK